MPPELAGAPRSWDDAIPLLVLGLGNVLCGDDGLGPQAVALLNRRYTLPRGFLALDGGTLGLSLLPLVARAENLILIDAVAADEASPGTFIRLEGDEVPPAVLHRLSPHQVGVADLLDALRLLDRLPRRLVLLGLVPAALELEVSLSPELEGALPALVDEVVAEARGLGFDLEDGQ